MRVAQFQMKCDGRRGAIIFGMSCAQRKLPARVDINQISYNEIIQIQVRVELRRRKNANVSSDVGLISVSLSLRAFLLFKTYVNKLLRDDDEPLENCKMKIHTTRILNKSIFNLNI